MKRIMSGLTRDVVIKVLAVLVAVVLWTQAFNQQNPMISAELTAMPISLVDLPDGLTIVDARPRTVTVSVRGRREAVERLSRRDVVVWASLSGLMPTGTTPVEVQTAVPPVVEVVDVRPRSLDVTLDRIVQRQIPVEIIVEGEVAAEHLLGEVTIRPADILIEGPESRVLSVRSAQTILDVSGATGDVVRTLPVRLLTEGGDSVIAVNSMPQTVEVSAPVVRRAPAKDVKIQVRATGQTAEGYVVSSVSVEPQTVRIRGPADVIAAVGSLSVTVDVSGARDNVTVDYHLALPDGILSADPRQVRITARVEREAHQVLSAVPVRVVNVGDGLRASVDAASVAVAVTGAESRLTALNAADVTVEIDAAGLEPGEHDVRPRLILPSGLRGTVEPELIRIRISDGE